ncbi:MAG: prepilin-type N-terminal cleavage/methylation domain-containing protein [Clostridia bacterium]|nr:prepilin-type N-terminal cleavage/methylation domain-containing protein [Clostridia bacterium]
MKKSNKGFTIVELVIVIAVVSILAAVLIPTFANVIQKAKHSAATSNIANAYTSYLSEDSDNVVNRKAVVLITNGYKGVFPGNELEIQPAHVQVDENAALKPSTVLTGTDSLEVDDQELVKSGNHYVIMTVTTAGSGIKLGATEGSYITEGNDKYYYYGRFEGVDVYVIIP